MDINCYVPDELGQWAKDAEVNFSQTLRTGLEAEREHRRAAAALLRKPLAEYLDHQARWRQAKAEESPADPRHEASSGALSAAAEHVRAMSEDAPYFAHLKSALDVGDDSLDYLSTDDVLLPGEEAAREASVYGYHRRTSYPAEEFLTVFLDASKRDRIDAEIEHEIEIEIEHDADAAAAENAAARAAEGEVVEGKARVKADARWAQAEPRDADA